MIDRDARTKLSEAIRSLASGIITNDDFEDRIGDFRSKDAAINALEWDGRSLYSDFHSHKLRGKYRLSKEEKSDIARWILFLQTDLPYEWKDYGGLTYFFLSLLTFGLATKFYFEPRFVRQGDIVVWPFIRRSEYEAALQNPAYLTGTEITTEDIEDTEIH